MNSPSPTGHHTGMSPGVLIARPDANQTVLRCVRYNAEHLDDQRVASVADLPDVDVARGNLWIDVDGLADLDALHELGQRYDLHPLLLEDVVNTQQRPKIETYGDDLFLISRVAPPPPFETLQLDQVGVLLRPGLLITFHERITLYFEPVHQRMANAAGRIRTRGSDFLAYALVDAVIDGYLPVLDNYGERVDKIEDNMLEDINPEDLKVLHSIRRDLIRLRRVLIPQRESVHTLLRGTLNSAAFNDGTLVYLRDTYDHVVRTLDQVDGYRELAASLMELYMSTVSNRTNDVMKVLTMISTIFIPLSFLVGLYGMNFDTTSRWNMPELGFDYGYPMLLSTMATLVIGLGYYFYRKGWF